jgi:hypothetical protein
VLINVKIGLCELLLVTAVLAILGLDSSVDDGSFSGVASDAPSERWAELLALCRNGSICLVVRDDEVRERRLQVRRGNLCTRRSADR